MSNPEIDTGVMSLIKIRASRAERNWAISLTKGGKVKISSIKLTIARIIPHNRARNKFVSSSFKYHNKLIPRNQVVTIATPPPLGVGISCELLSFGISRRECLRATFLIMKVRKYEIRINPAAIYRMSLTKSEPG